VVFSPLGFGQFVARELIVQLSNMNANSDKIIGFLDMMLQFDSL
jgi:hypothetical protein